MSKDVPHFCLDDPGVCLAVDRHQICGMELKVIMTQKNSRSVISVGK